MSSTGSTSRTSTSTAAMQYPFHNKAFYANGRYWLFYYDGTDGVYTTSTDGISWDSAIQYDTDINGGTNNDVYFDGTYVHYVYQTSGTPGTTYYRRGTTVSDGTISWSAARQSFTHSTSNNRPSLIVNSSGNAFIGTVDATNYPVVYKNANTDGTWSTEGSWPVQLNTANADATWRVGFALVNGEVLAVYSRSYNAMYAKLYSGSGTTWGLEETAYSAYGLDYGYAFTIGFDTTNDDTYVFLVNYTPYDHILIKRTSAGTWSVDQTLDTTGDYMNYSIGLNVLPGGDLYCWIANIPTADKVQYKKRVSDSWDGSWTEISGTNILNSGCFATIHHVLSGKVAAFWAQGASSPYTLYYFVDSVSAGETESTIYIDYLKF